jgi:hypothetical protein
MYLTRVTIILKGVHVAGHQVYSMPPMLTWLCSEKRMNVFIRKQENLHCVRVESLSRCHNIPSRGSNLCVALYTFWNAPVAATHARN